MTIEQLAQLGADPRQWPTAPPSSLPSALRGLWP
ncbi:hypothetical protein F4553_007965 [Allocatelliglobosispora scoriae]|uniref:Uncharacterized protein n=1 Tax=Allocatelliglobosispora scoriae TaxID=643052 RepID=A0A841C6X0_9ACTN|nr:hypothetical protein [Allocatelliglobosispora scoriae]